MASQQAKQVAVAGGIIVCDPTLESFDARYFDIAYWRSQGRARDVATGRGANWFVRAPQGEWVLRHYRRGGLVARLSADRYLFTGYERTRALREWHLLRLLRTWHLPVPRPIAARVLRSGLCYRADLITQRIRATQTLSALVLEGAVTRQNLEITGRAVRALHEREVWHADLNAHNILIDDTGTAHVIDFDRGRLRPGTHWHAANLSRLRRSLDKISGGAFADSDWEVLLSAYRTSPAHP